TVVLEQTDAGAAAGILWHETRDRVLVLQVLVDDGGLVHHLVLVDQDRDFAVGIQAQEIRRLLLLLAQVDEDLLVLEILLRQNHAHLLAEGAIWVVIERQHSLWASLPASTPPPQHLENWHGTGKARPWQ